MGTRLYINPTMEKKIRNYCEANSIEDVNAFANRCVLQGLNIILYGTSPTDNVEREKGGIKDVIKTKTPKEEKPLNPIEESTQETDLEEIKPIKKIRIIKKL